ncbi:MAG: hypothetical protein F6K03_11550, partial [Kamptonema sp. SIO4C4]|nr:hypothetical protein [Kamptonema sp. SIO4C4]
EGLVEVVMVEVEEVTVEQEVGVMEVGVLNVSPIVARFGFRSVRDGLQRL